MKKLLISTLILAYGISASQLFPKNASSTKESILKGSDTEYRNFWDVKKYDISVEANFADKSLKGNNKISYQITKNVKDPIFQIDLQQPMQFELTTKAHKVSRDKDFIFIQLKGNFKKGDQGSFDINFSGNPLIAKNAPWDGGWVFTKDSHGNPWASVAQEGNGASLWLPIKDIWSDEPENGIIMKITTPKDLVGVGNGRLIKVEIEKNNKKSYTWKVINPINDYSIVPTIGKLVNFKDSYQGEKGNLDLDYWVLEENLEKAKIQFGNNVKPMLKALEYWFGPYPFYEDSYKLVETPYLGMEHQSNVAYGNKYLNGYLGRDLSGTGVGLHWDFIIVHESGHEWYANNITAKDRADMWIHESFTSYSETLFTERFMDKASGDKYLQGTRLTIQNDKPIIGKYGENEEGSGDMYSKGANMLHTIRQVINDDEKFRQILRGMNKDFYHQTVTSKQIEDYISKKSGIDFSSVFDQYLRTIKIPTLEFAQKGNQLTFRYTNIVDGLKLPVRLTSGQSINPNADWQTIILNSTEPVQWDNNYYITYKDVK